MATSTDKHPPPPTPADTCVLRLRGVGKRFGTLHALDGVDADFHAGEVHAVLGENGAGKSTLMNVMYGLLQADTGTILLDGKTVSFTTPQQARAAGIGMVHQEFALVDALSVAENLALALQPAGRICLRIDTVRRAARRVSREVGLDIGDLDDAAGSLPVGVRQRVEIVKALAGHTRILILDEPTAVLAPAETEQLFEVVDRLRARGVAVIFISHKLREVLAIADRVTVLRQGRRVATRRRAQVDEASLAELMIGSRPIAPPPRAAQPAAGHGTGLFVSGLHAGRSPRNPALYDIRLRVARGEIFAVAGVDGNGQDDLFASLTGLRRPHAGSMSVDGRAVPWGDPPAAIDAGIGSIPPDRGRQGLMPEASLCDNALLNRTLLRRLARGLFLGKAETRALAQDLVDAYAIRATSTDMPAAGLSGGNQQRLVVARTLAAQPRVLVAFNPGRGLDITAARTVHEALRDTAARGAAVLLISTDLDEALRLGDRLAVLYNGRLSRTIERPFPVEGIGRLMAGAANAPAD